MRPHRINSRTWFPFLVSLTESLHLRPLTRWLCRAVDPPILLQ
jgi:hypothetical protein